MQVNDKIIVVTGAASGIGKALTARFKAEGAKQIVAVDLNEAGAAATADEVGCIAMPADVSREADIVRVIDHTEADVGPIDLFCSNAGIGMGMDLAAPNSEWQRSWDVNLMSHVYAARHLVPKMAAHASIIAPIAIAIPPRLMMLAPIPSQRMPRNAIRIPMGSVTMTTSALRA